MVEADVTLSNGMGTLPAAANKGTAEAGAGRMGTGAAAMPGSFRDVFSMRGGRASTAHVSSKGTGVESGDNSNGWLLDASNMEAVAASRVADVGVDNTGRGPGGRVGRGEESTGTVDGGAMQGCGTGADNGFGLADVMGKGAANDASWPDTGAAKAGKAAALGGV